MAETTATMIRDWRRARGLTQGELALKCGLHMMTVSRIENGSSPSARNLARIANALQMDAKATLRLFRSAA